MLVIRLPGMRIIMCDLAGAEAECNADRVQIGTDAGGALLANPEPMLARLIRGCIALTFNACVLAVACSHRLADAVKGGQLSYMALAMQASEPRTDRY